jgi:hypothetical protein
MRSPEDAPSPGSGQARPAGGGDLTDVALLEQQATAVLVAREGP